MRSCDGRPVPWDVIVVGAGPAGSAVAALLAGEGLGVLILEKAVGSLPAKVCGEYLSPGCLPLLRRLCAPAALPEAARPLYGVLLHTVSGRVLRATYSRVGALSEPSCPVHGLSLPRAQLDAFLLDWAVKRGAVIESGFQVCDVDRKHPLVGVTGRRYGVEATRRARLVVGADGRASVVARRLGTVRPHPWLDKMALVGYVTHVEREAEWAEVFLGPDRYAILNPVAEGVTNVGVVVNRRDVPGGGDPRRSLWAMARQMPALGTRLREARFTAPPRCLGPLAYRATVLAAPGALLVGDAAGFLDPFTGEGIYAALRSAELASRCVLSGWTPVGPRPDAFAEYARAWTREFAPKFRFGVRLQRAIRRPNYADWLVTLLARRPALSATLLDAAGDRIPPGDLSLWHLMRRGVRRPGSGI